MVKNKYSPPSSNKDWLKEIAKAYLDAKGRGFDVEVSEFLKYLVSLLYGEHRR